MSSSRSKDSLVEGLRALELLVTLAPVDLSGFAEAACVTSAKAAALIRAYESAGYVARLPSGHYIVLPFALELLSNAASVRSARLGTPPGRIH